MFIKFLFIKKSDDGYEEYVKELMDLFDRFAYNGKLTMPNKTIAYIGQMR